jgi:large subunit ribosomal protein L4
MYIKPQQIWIEDLMTSERKIGLITLHPDVFRAQPRLDIIYENIIWQRLYRHVVSKVFINM